VYDDFALIAVFKEDRFVSSVKVDLFYAERPLEKGVLNRKENCAFISTATSLKVINVFSNCDPLNLLKSLRK
jgi:hypothetical protein